MPDDSPWVTVLVAAAATYFWRALGVALSGRINPNGVISEWIGCVAYALLAGLIARMIVLPIGPLHSVGLGIRLTAAAVALAVFYLARRSILLGVFAGAGALVGLTLLTLE